MTSLQSVQYQRPAAPFNDAGRRALQDLVKNGAASKRFEEQLRKSIEQLTKVSSDLNDRAQDRRQQHAEKESRFHKRQMQEPEDERQTYEDFQQNVKILTTKMDNSIRTVIDHQTWYEDLPDTLREVVTRSAESARTDAVDDEDSTEAQSTSTARVAPVDALRNAIDQYHTAWQAKSLTAKYSTNNDYLGWRRAVWDAQHPGETTAVMPDATSWFAAEEGRDRSVREGNRATQGDASDDEIEVAAEKTRTTCPITLLPFKDPVTSDVCRHSFEKSAILEMFQTTEGRLYSPEEQAQINQCRPRDRPQKMRQLGTRQVKCPECDAPFTQNSLKPNPGLQLRVQRLENARKKQQAQESEEDSEEEDDIPRGTQRRPTNVASMRNPKVERMSVVPQTQLSE